jgi:hypothetical protein
MSKFGFCRRAFCVPLPYRWRAPRLPPRTRVPSEPGSSCPAGPCLVSLGLVDPAGPVRPRRAR